MDPKLQQALADYMQTLLAVAKDAGSAIKSGVQQGASFAKEQIPQVIMEKLHYDFAIAMMWIGIGLAIPTVAWFIRHRIIQSTMFKGLPAKTSSYGQSDQSEWRIATAIIACILTFIPTVPIIIINLQTAMNIYFAPRLYIIDWLARMVRPVVAP